MNTFFCCLFAAINAAVSELPPSGFADTEVSTNIPVVVDSGEMSRLVFSLSLDASPSNAVEVAIGTDADNNGNLAPDEADLVFGCNCGTWFRRDAVRDRLDVLGTANPAAGRTERTFILKRRAFDTCWNLVRVTRRGAAPVCECASVEGRFPGLNFIVR